ncbi:hypothetical protein [uncultured Sunxiuqinia sp.]|uniref:hypothetical protein n=1 Tax=uncultured Sunxiuqinia sp. TaxID=1573825 RepID=UPI002AA6275E|nr:hypothetical protein [uncultured Sunxiuqinia sp.]
MNKLRKLMIALAALLFLSSWQFLPDDDCTVLLPKISENYEGDCKRGKAHGVGKAVGEDSYEGEFKKGLPEGNGTYTWSNGDVYQGNWKDGLKEGEGKLVIKRETQPDSILVGFWKDDEYIGKYEKPYEVESKSSNINKLVITKKSLTPSQVEIIIMRKNSKVGISGLRINSNAGSFYDNKFIVDKFPLEMEIEFDSKSATGFGAAKEKFTCKVKISEEGNWQVNIDLSNV